MASSAASSWPIRDSVAGATEGSFSDPKPLERFSDWLMSGTAVPFLGAGVSVPSGCENPRLDGHARQRELTRFLTDAIDVLAPSGVTGQLFAHQKQAELARQAKSTDGPAPSLAVLSEIYLESVRGMPGDPEWSFPLARLVLDVLEIHKFRHLLPTPAHRRIAWLARETCVAEVVTTNYDCNIERAWIESFGNSGLGPTSKLGPIRLLTDCDPQYPAELGKYGLAVAHDTASYRDATHRASSGSAYRRCRLLVHKINGCAAHLAIAEQRALKAPEDRRALDERRGAIEAVLLTERQLQSWRERSWAADLFRDRLRTRHLVFSGFGSEEPQVRHTMVMVAEELARRRDQPPKAALDAANAPLIQGFLRSPTFPQWQVLTAFGDARSDGRHELFVGPDEFRPCFVERTDGALPSNAFWTELHAHVATRLLRAHASHNSKLHSMLQGVTASATAIIANFRRELGTSDEPSDVSRALWNVDGDVPVATRLLHALLHPGFGRAPTGAYYPILDYGDLLLLALWAIRVLLPHGAFPDQLDARALANGYALLRVPRPSNTVARMPVLLASRMPDHIPALDLPPEQPILVVLLGTQQNTPPRTPGRLGSDRIQPALQAVSFLSCVQEAARRATHLAGFDARLRDALLYALHLRLPSNPFSALTGMRRP